MQFTLIGAATLALCLTLMLRGGMLAQYFGVLWLSLLGGSAAFFLTGLGNSSVQPAILALALLVLRCLFPSTGGFRPVDRALADNAFLILFTLYGIAGALILPHLFAGSIDVTPLRPNPDGYIYAKEPLRFTSQNITAPGYLAATLCAALCSYLALSANGSEGPMARAAGGIALVHGALGISGVILAGTPFSAVFAFFRNGFYAQLNQSVEGFVRMNGIWPEPAVYASYGFAWLVFATELWLRGVESRWTGLGAALLALALLLSTSTTAYIGLGTYGVLLALRLALIPGRSRSGRGLILLGVGLVALAIALGLLAMLPDLAARLGEIFARFTLDKADSASAAQRGFWARQGWDAFLASGGLGIGPGSFRSSSILTAILGSCGVIGAAAFLLHWLRVFQPLRASTYALDTDPRTATGAAAGWAATVMLIPAAFSAASPDPGIVWGFFSGMALALRSGAPAARRTSATILRSRRQTVTSMIERGSDSSPQGAR